MKKTTSLWLIIVMLFVNIPSMGAMSINKMRQNARFLTDRMAYELHLSPLQYDDVYEVNYDFINSVRYIMDDVVRGYDYAVDRYYDYLNYRNDDLRWILSASQYRRFMGVDYFYRPIYTTANRWVFRIYNVYHDVKHFYFGKPHHYKTYHGDHSRMHHHAGYYKQHHQNRYQHDYYKGDVKVHYNKPVAGNRRPGNVVQPKPKKERPSVNTARPSTNKPSMENKGNGQRRTGATVKESRKEPKQNAQKVERKETQKRTNSRGGNSRQESGRKASRGR